MEGLKALLRKLYVDEQVQRIRRSFEQVVM